MRLRAHLPLLAAAFVTTTTPASAWTILAVGPAGLAWQRALRVRPAASSLPRLAVLLAMQRVLRWMMASCSGLAIIAPASATVITVGPGQSISAAVAGAHAGDDIQVAAGTYTNDFPTVSVPLTIE